MTMTAVYVYYASTSHFLGAFPGSWISRSQDGGLPSGSSGNSSGSGGAELGLGKTQSHPHLCPIVRCEQQNNNSKV